MRTIAGAIGLAVFVALMTAATAVSSGSADVTANAHGMNVTYSCISIVAVVQLVLAVIFVGKKRKTEIPRYSLNPEK